MTQGITHPRAGLIGAVATAILIASTGIADAQQTETAPEQAQLEEIVVTAQKRETTVDKTPISITAVSGKDLQDRGITDFSTLAGETPGVSMKTNGPGQTEFEMRGMIPACMT
jgi:iron complex outermembrane recepter protein